MSPAPHLLPKVQSRFQRVGADDDPGIGEVNDAIQNRIVARPNGPTAAVWVSGEPELNPVAAGAIGHCLIGGGHFGASHKTCRDIAGEWDFEAMQRAHVGAALGF